MHLYHIQIPKKPLLDKRWLPCRVVPEVEDHINRKVCIQAACAAVQASSTGKRASHLWGSTELA